MSTNDSLPDDVETLKRLLLASNAELDQARAEAASTEALVVHLRLMIEKLKRDLFGARNERNARLIDQMELQLEELEAAATEDEIAAEQAVAASSETLNRQSERYAREGIDLSVSTLADQIGGCAVLLRPLYELIRAHVFAGERVHGDKTPVPVLAKHETRKGRLWGAPHARRAGGI
jgi:multidrug efflux pump subunit AcrA (membrane-fusion protein)